MDFKDLASKLIDDISGIQTKVENEQIKTIKEDLELDLDLNFNENDSNTDFDLDIEDEIEQIKLETSNEQLFDGYLGEKNFDPNPLEYGPNAMYRKNGTVYRKSVDNLWEEYLKDGSPGPRGAAGGSGVGVQEAKQIATEIVNTAMSSISGTSSTVEQRRGNKVLFLGNSIGADSFGISFGGSASNGYSKLLNTAISVGYQAAPSYRYLKNSEQFVLKCISAGTTNPSFEPLWPDIGQTIVEGTVTWEVIKTTENINAGIGVMYMALALLGQPLDPIGYIAASGRRANYIINLAKKLLTTLDPDIIIWSGTWENDIAQTPTMSQTSANFDEFKSFCDDQIKLGRKIIISSVYPPGTANLAINKQMCDYYSFKSEEYARLNNNYVQYFDTPSYLYNSLIQGNDWTPDTQTKFLVESSGTTGADWSDGVHPLNVARYKLAKAHIPLIKKLDFPKMTLSPYSSAYQRWPTPSNTGTSGTFGVGVSGVVKAGAFISRGAGIVSAYLEKRTDINAYWQVISASSSASTFCTYAEEYNLTSLGLSAGDMIDIVIEVENEYLSPTVKNIQARVEYKNGAKPNTFNDWNWSGITNQFLGQVINDEKINIVFKPIKIPTPITTGTTSIVVTVVLQGYSSWDGIIKIGRINLRKIN